MSGSQHQRTTRAAERGEAVMHGAPLRPAVFRELPGALLETVATPGLGFAAEEPRAVAQRPWAA